MDGEGQSALFDAVRIPIWLNRSIGRIGQKCWQPAAKASVQIALLFLFFHKRLCGPLADSRFHHCPDTAHQPASKLEAAYHRADKAIQRIVDLLPA